MTRVVHDTQPSSAAPAVQSATAGPSFAPSRTQGGLAAPPRAQSGLAVRPPDRAPERKGEIDAGAPLFKTSGQPVMRRPAVLQRKLVSPQFAGDLSDEELFPGHLLEFMDPMNVTGCGTNNHLTTDGSEYEDDVLSEPGNPTDMGKYKTRKKGKGFEPPYSRVGGLVRDKRADKAAIRMHLINHHLDPKAGDNGTQRNRKNIMLGTEKSNDDHSKTVEVVIKSAIKKYSSGENGEYEGALTEAEVTHDDKKSYVLFWEKKPSEAAINIGP